MMGQPDRGIRVEVEEHEDLGRSARYGLGNVSSHPVSSMSFDRKGIQESFAIIRIFADAIETQLRKTNVSDAEIAFGLKLSPDGSFSVSSTPDKGNYIVKLKWSDTLRDRGIE